MLITKSKVRSKHVSRTLWFGLAGLALVLPACGLLWMPVVHPVRYMGSRVVLHGIWGSDASIARQWSELAKSTAAPGLHADYGWSSGTAWCVFHLRLGKLRWSGFAFR